MQRGDSVVLDNHTQAAVRYWFTAHTGRHAIVVYPTNPKDPPYPQFVDPERVHGPVNRADPECPSWMR